MRVLLVPVLLFCCLYSKGQQAGCFKKSADSMLTLETNIDFSNYNVFFLGEFHGVYGVPEVKLSLIKYLNKTYGITDVFMEFGNSAAYLYNRYLATGDTTYFVEPVLTMAYKKPNRDFWKELYNYNRQLSRKIIVHGIDFERMEFVKALKLLKPAGKAQPAELKPVLDYINVTTVRNVSRDSITMLDSVYSMVRKDVEDKEAIYKAYYGDNYSLVREILFNENTYKDYPKRNKTMYMNLMEKVRDNNIHKFLVVAGLNHANMSYAGWQSLCFRLAKGDAFRGKVAGIAMACKNCYDWQLAPQYRHAAWRGPYTYYEDSALMDSIYNNYFIPGCKYTIIPTSAIDNAKVRNYSQYIILMKDQGEF